MIKKQTKEVFEKWRVVVVCIYIYTIDLLFKRQFYNCRCCHPCISTHIYIRMDSYSISSDHLKKPEHHPLVMGCCFGAKAFSILSILVSRARHSSSRYHFNVSSMTQCGPDSNPTSPRQQACCHPCFSLHIFTYLLNLLETFKTWGEGRVKFRDS